MYWGERRNNKLWYCDTVAYTVTQPIVKNHFISGLNKYYLESIYHSIKHSVVRWEEMKNKVTFKSLVSAARSLRRLYHPFSFVGRSAPEVPYISLLVLRVLTPQITRIADKYLLHRDQESKRREFFGPEHAYPQHL
ncbi:hypothetical protein TNCV_4500001 [Trichonephila clavipes]|nr:hypothetical protein TNCV_4500001 [Trichonephila clavipes]